MPTPTIQHAFTAGELSPTLWSRTDLEKYDLGLSLAYNTFIDYRGGASSRPGFEYAAELTNPTEASRIFRFDFGVSIANTYVMIFGGNYIRFVQDGGYVLEEAKVISDATQTYPCVITCTAHGFATGALVYLDQIEGMTELNDRLFLVTVLSADTFKLSHPYDISAELDASAFTAYTGSGLVSRVYTVATPYAAANLKGLVVEQRSDAVVITSADFPPYELRRNDTLDWVLAPLAFASSANTPTGLSGAASGSGSATVGYTVTAVVNGEESLPARLLVLSNIVNFTTVSGQVVLSWTPVSGAQYYKVYRTTVAPESSGVIGAELTGYIGTTYGPIFTDGNIVPDFTATPPLGYDPFAGGAVDYINITAGGSGYSQATATVALTGDGSGFTGYPIVSGGAIIGVFILQRGRNYTSASVSFTGGTGATATATLTPIAGNNPRASKIFQQRQIFGGTDNKPLGVFGTKPGAFRNFDAAQIPTAGDSYEIELAAERNNPIQYFVDLRRNLIAFTGSGVWNITGGNDIAVTPINVNAEAQTYIGSANIRPISIDNDILYVQEENGVVRALSYNRISDVYTGTDRSVLSNHFFTKNRGIVNWAYAQAPFYLIWCVRSDGRLLTMTYLKEQEVYAWTGHETLGRAKDVAVVPEYGRSVPYFIVEREIAGVTRKFIERATARDGDNAEDYMCVDCGVTQGPIPGVGTLRVSAATGNVTVRVTNGAPFSVDDIGADIRTNNGVIKITDYVSPSEVTGTVRVPLTDTYFKGAPIPTEQWTIARPFTEVSGLWHLEGMTVSALCNGTPLTPKPVVNGKISVPPGTTIAHVGLGFTWRVRTLPAVFRDRVIEGKLRVPVKLDVRVHLTRGLYVGTTPETSYFVVERSDEHYDTPTRLQSGIKTANIVSSYDKEGIIELSGDAPLPATVLGYTLYLSVGDDDDED